MKQGPDSCDNNYTLPVAAKKKKMALGKKICYFYTVAVQALVSNSHKL